MAKSLRREQIDEKSAICASCISSQGQFFDERNCPTCQEGLLATLPRLRKEKRVYYEGLVTYNDLSNQTRIA